MTFLVKHTFHPVERDLLVISKSVLSAASRRCQPPTMALNITLLVNQFVGDVRDFGS
jgi:hypothetical protein